MKIFQLFLAWSKMAVAAEIAYKANFILRMIMLVFFDMLSPLAAYLIYSASNGLPGWSFEQFLLLQGTLIFVFGIGSFSFMRISHRVTDLLIRGQYDIILIRPYNALKFLTSTSIDLEHIAEVFTGLVIMIYSVIALEISFNLVNVLMFLALIMLALMFIYTVNVVISSIAFYIINTRVLTHVFYRFSDIAQYPLGIYDKAGFFLFSFVFPLGILAFYPAEALLRGLEYGVFFRLAFAIIGVFLASLLFWNIATKRYAGAGG